MHCNGKCYLMKKLRCAEEKEKKQESQRTVNPLFCLPDLCYSALPFQISEPIIPLKAPSEQSATPFGYSRRQNKPPKSGQENFGLELLVFREQSEEPDPSLSIRLHLL